MTATKEAIELANLIAQAADEKLGENIIAFDVSDHLAITDIFVVISANSERQVDSIMEAIEEELIQTQQLRPTRREGDRELRWVLLDYVDVVVHIQHVEERELYSLERLWRDCPPIELQIGADNPAQLDQ